MQILNFFLEASIECSAKRRFNEFDNNDIAVTLSKIKKLLIDRDYIDINRKISPLKKATTAVLINTTDLKIDEVVDIIYEKIKRRKSLNSKTIK
jgi:cytidylate kinase